MPNNKVSTSVPSRQAREASGATTVRVSRLVRDRLEVHRARMADVRKPEWQRWARRTDFTMDDLLAEVLAALDGGRLQ